MEAKKELSFEENLEKLEIIVKKLENGDIPLDDAINEFNEAMKIAKICDTKLKNAEDSLNKIVKEDGSIENFSIESD
ncbi:MAG: exodeoxyribonuclease VII small subunit [bacterium]|nr:exodeoxyribonuclease VII small subunit [bacterium]